MHKFSNTIGVEDNEMYPKFKEKERLIMNVSTCKYFVIRFVAKSLFNFKVSFKPIEEDKNNMLTYEYMVQNTCRQEVEDWDIFWTDNSV
jgi:hypothetical protein